MNPCPCCGLVILDREHRFGVELTHFKARLVDVVRRAGPDGIYKDDLHAIMYANTRKEGSYPSLYTAIRRTNALLAKAGKRIRGHSTEHVWRLVSTVSGG